MWKWVKETLGKRPSDVRVQSITPPIVVFTIEGERYEWNQDTETGQKV